MPFFLLFCGILKGNDNKKQEKNWKEDGEVQRKSNKRDPDLFKYKKGKIKTNDLKEERMKKEHKQSKDFDKFSKAQKRRRRSRGNGEIYGIKLE